MIRNIFSHFSVVILSTLILLSGCGGGGGVGVGGVGGATISGIVTDDPLANATVDVYSLTGTLITSSTTDATGNFTISGVNQSSVANGFELVATGGTLLGAPFTGEMRAIYGPQDNASQANVTLVTTLIAGVARAAYTTPATTGLLAQRDAAILRMSNIGMIQAASWNQVAPTGVDILALRHQMLVLGGVVAWRTQMVTDLSDGVLSTTNMGGFNNAHGGLRSVNIGNRLEVMVGETIHTPITLNGLPNVTYSKQILSGPTGMTIDANGILNFTPPAGTAGGTSIPFTVRVTNTANGLYRDLVANVYVMKTDTLISATTDALGGTYYSPWRDAYITVPAGATTGTATVKLLRGTRLNGSYLYKITSSVQLPGATYSPPAATLRGAQSTTGTPVLRSHQPASLRERTVGSGWTLVKEYYATYWEVDTCGENSVNRAPYNPGGRSVDIIGYGSKKSSALYHYTTPNLSSPATSKPVMLVNGFGPSGQGAGANGTWVGIGGLGGGDSTWGLTGELLSGLGYDVYEFDWRTNARFKDAANDLAMAINEVVRATGKKVNLIAHSFGGLLSRTYLQGLASALPYRNDVASLITFGTPHSGISDTSNNTITFTSPNGVQKSITLPKGRDDNNIIPKSGQLSVDNAGHSNAWWALAPGVWSRTLLDPLGTCLPGVSLSQNFQLEPSGSLIAKLADTLDYPLPSDVPIKVMIGLTYKTRLAPIPSGPYVFENGDALISYAGQRFSPSFGNTATSDGLNIPLTGFPGANQVMEEMIGLYHGAVPAGALDTARMSPFLLDLYNKYLGKGNVYEAYQGYRHTGAWSLLNIRGLVDEVNIVNAKNTSFITMKNWLGSGIAAWRAARSVNPVPMTPAQNITLHVRVIDGVALQANTPLQYANVSFYLTAYGTTPVSSGSTDAQGNFTATVGFFPNTTYRVDVTSPSTGLISHATISMQGTLATSPREFGNLILMTGVNILLPPTVAQHGNINGVITDALNGLGIAGVAYQIFDTASNSTTPVRSGLTSATGNYSELGLIAGNYTIKLSKAGYSSSQFNLFVAGNTSNAGNSGLSPVLQAGQMRIILRWGLNPPDLDSHLVKYNAAGVQQYHIFYAAKTGLGGDNLNLDDTTSYGPETVTIQTVDPTARYVYAVHNYSGAAAGTITGGSNANINVSQGASSQLLNAPTTGAGPWWKVFEIVNGQVTPCTNGCMFTTQAAALRSFTPQPNWLKAMQKGMTIK